MHNGKVLNMNRTKELFSAVVFAAAVAAVPQT